MANLDLKCHCGSMQGVAEDVSPRTGNRLACCCKDCQAFAKFLGSESQTLDEYGATDIVQLPVACIKIESGIEHLACVRLSEKGLFRWYAGCCKTPIGNTLGAASPFIGLIHDFIPDIEAQELVLGKSRGHIQIKGASKNVPTHLQGNVMILFRSLYKLLVWKIQGLNKPSVFFDDHGQCRVFPTVLSKEHQA